MASFVSETTVSGMLIVKLTIKFVEYVESNSISITIMLIVILVSDL